MADWFVYQRDLYPNELDPDNLGISLLPLYDSANRVRYRDDGQASYNGLRRVHSYWGVDREIVQFDLYIERPAVAPTRHGVPPLSSPSLTAQTVQWFPQEHQFQFTNLVDGFQMENLTLQQCMVVTRHTNLGSCAKLVERDAHGRYTAEVGRITIVRVHRLTLLSPHTLDTSMFSKYVTSCTPLPEPDVHMT